MRCAPCIVGTCFLVGATGCVRTDSDVPAVRPAIRDIERVLATDGLIEAAGAAAVHSPMAGRVQRVEVRQGDSVASGQVLLRLADEGQGDDRSEALAALDVAEARLAQVEDGIDRDREAALRGERSGLMATRASAQGRVERLKRLVAKHAAPLAELEAEESRLRSVVVAIDAVDAQISAAPRPSRVKEARAAVAEAKARAHAAGGRADRLAVRAPRAGTIYSLPVAEGDFLPAGGLVARIGMAGTVRARIFVDEPDLGLVARGSNARLTADAFPGRGWECAVTDLATEIAERGPRRLGEVLCAAANPDGALLPNLSVRVTIVTGRAERALSIPRSALRGGESEYVWTETGGRAERRAVSVGLRGPDHVEILRGLDRSDLVLLPAAGELAERQRVRIVEGSVE